MDANEKLISLETAPRAATRSPSPRKRKLDQETPEQKFVDARATPFTQRKRQSTSLSQLVPNQDTPAEEGYETADDAVTESNGSSRTLVESPINGPIQSSRDVPDLILGQQLVASDEQNNSDSESDDEAPEAISNIKGAQTAKAIQEAKDLVLHRRAEEAREKRKRKDEKLREQRKTQKAVATTGFAETTIAEEEEEEVAGESGGAIELQKSSSRPSIPRILPDEVLNAPVASTNTVSVAPQAVPASSHVRFEPKKELTFLNKGPLSVQLLRKQRNDLAPKKSASVSNTKSQWLYRRGSSMTDRRPVRKPLA